MLLKTKLQSKTLLIVMLSIITFHAPVQAFSATETLGKVKDLVLENPQAALIGAGVMCIIGGFIALIKHENAEYSRRAEENRIAAEQLRAQQAAEQARIDALPIDQFAEYIGLDITSAQAHFAEIDGPKILELHKQLSYDSLIQEERKSLKKQLKKICLAAYGNDFYTKCKSDLNHAAQAITRRLELNPDVAFMLQPVLKWMDTFKEDITVVQQEIKRHVKKVTDKEAAIEAARKKDLYYSHRNYYPFGCGIYWCTICPVYHKPVTHINVVVQPAAPRQQTNATPKHNTEASSKNSQEDQCYDFNNPYHTLIGD